MIEYCQSSKVKKYRTLLKKLESIPPEIKTSMLDLYYRKVQHTYAAQFYEWRKYQLEKKGLEFENYQAMQERIEETKRLQKYMFEGMDETILEVNRYTGGNVDYKKTTIESKLADSPTLKLTSKNEDRSPTDKVKKARKLRNSLATYNHKSIKDVMMNLSVPPFFFYIPTKLEMQSMIRKA